MLHLVWYILVGLIAGIIAKSIMHAHLTIFWTIVLGIIVSGVYPLIVWGIAQTLFNNKANGSLLGKDGQSVSKDADAVGSSLIGQSFGTGQMTPSQHSQAQRETP